MAFTIDNRSCAMGYDEIAAELGCTRYAVQETERRALRKLRRVMGPKVDPIEQLCLYAARLERGR